MSHIDYTVDQLGMNHFKCEFSTGIDNSLTAGQGSLDDHGFWSVPCPDCARRMTLILECDGEDGITLRNGDL